LRRVGSDNFVTYKGAKIDNTTKTRRELELPLTAGSEAAAQFRELLEALGFRPVANVANLRPSGNLDGEGHDVEIALEHMAEVGMFVEIELTADDDTLDAARDCLASLAAKLELRMPERRSYLEMLLERREKKSV